jgi:hypothetical protein
MRELGTGGSLLQSQLLGTQIILETLCPKSPEQNGLGGVAQAVEGLL